MPPAACLRTCLVAAGLFGVPGLSWTGPRPALGQAQTVVLPAIPILPAARGVTRSVPLDALPPEVRAAMAVAGAPGAPGVPGPEGAGATNAAPDPAEVRVQQLMQVRVDRRPEALLQAGARRLGASPGPAAGVGGMPMPMPAPGPGPGGAGAGGGTNETELLQADLQSGNWRGVSALLQTLSTNHAAQVYDHVLQQFLTMPGQPGGGGRPGMPVMPAGVVMSGGMPGQPMMPGVPPPSNFLVPDDVLGLANVCPGELTEGRMQTLGQLLTRLLQGVPTVAPLVARLEAGVGRLGGVDPGARDLAARLLIAAGRLPEAGRFIRPFDPQALPRDYALADIHVNLLSAEGRDASRGGGEAGAAERKAAQRRAWELNEQLLTDTNTPAREREAALGRAFELLPVLGRDGGSNWLRSRFTERPDLGAAVMAHVGGQVARGTTERMAANRLRALQQQKQAAENLIGSGVGLEPWKPMLLVMAAGWAREAEFTRSRPAVQPGMAQAFDPYGNPIYMGPQQRFQDPNQPEPVGAADLLEVVPGESWLAGVDAVTAGRVRAGVLQMQLRAGRYDEALPALERFAAEDPRVGRGLAHELLNGWAEARQPNRGNPYGQRVYYSPYMVNQGGEGIPLTRAQQERSLDELARLLARLRALPIDPLDDAVVVSAFTRAHSQAEVFRLEDIERVFGRLDGLRPETMSEILQAMRSRLAGQWRQPRVQQDGKTRRNDKEIAAEVRRGYEVVARLSGEAIGRKAGDWRLTLARAAVLYDWAEFEYGQKVDLAVYTGRRDEAFGLFEKAAAEYAAGVAQRDGAEPSPQVYQQWFNATLGASDLAYLTRQTEPSTNQLARIRRALLALPGDAAERHLEAFGRDLANASGGLKPELKPRYARSGLEVVGDHPSAREARELVRHYDDLLREILLDVRVDGDAAVGHGRPFGVFVSIRHTEAVGRESGGFARYLQNQGNQGYYYNPYGGGPVNYRDEFEKQVREKYADGFEILTVTFHDEKNAARGTDRPGWRDFPYAYLLLKAKDAGVDKLPPLQLSMDFADARGQVSLPVASAPVLIDARPAEPPARPARQLEVVQVLDDRELARGSRTATLEIKATARGLVPELDRLLDVALPGFRVAKTDDRGLTLSQMDAEGDEVAPVSERIWILTLEPDAAKGAPAAFVFPAARVEGLKPTFKRYADADLEEVPAQVAMVGLALRPDRSWLWAVGGAALGGIAWVAWRRRRPVAVEVAAAPRYLLPREITPFSVIHLLQRLVADAEAGLSAEQRAELGSTVADLQQRHFGRDTAPPPAGSDLRALAERWIALARR